ncbi:MAG: hypothetical protein FD167_1821 [bacterium]|nr:MAG: hypothetical protein FD167_1821 [bacterium]
MSKRIKILLALFFIFSIVFANTSSASQDPGPEKVQQAITNQIKLIEKWGKDPAIIKSITSQNKKKVTLSEIQAIDKTWMAATGINDFMKNLMSNLSAQRLKRLARSHLYAEVFVMDDQGALVAMTKKTSDYWQGDEAKWKKAFNDGKGATFVDLPQYDKSTDSILVQVSLPIKNTSGAAIGTITVGLNIDRLKNTIK